MSRRVFVTAKHIWEARAFNWEDHYQKHQQAEAYSMEQAIRTLGACAQMPEPTLSLYGSLEVWTYKAARAKPLDEYLQLLKESGTPSELFVKWYWSDTEWNNFVTLFNNLPEPEAMYEMVYDDYPHLEVVPYIMGTSRGQVRDNPLVVPKVGQKSR